jgi:3-dehydroquinate synthetase
MEAVSETEIPKLGNPLPAFQALGAQTVAQLNSKRLEYAAFRLGSAKGMKGELSSMSLAETDVGSESIGSDLCDMVSSSSCEETERKKGASRRSDINKVRAGFMVYGDVPPPPVPRFAPRARKSKKLEKTTWMPHTKNCECPETCDDYHTLPEASFADRVAQVNYFSVSSIAKGGDSELLKKVLDSTPKPKGCEKFSSVHVISPPQRVSPTVAEPLVACLQTAAHVDGVALHVHRLPDPGCQRNATAMEEYEAIFKTASSVILAKADRASLLLYVGWEDDAKDAYAALIGMLPFRGVSTALLTQRRNHGDLLRHVTPSGVFQVDGRDAGRMGMFPLHAIFGTLPSTTASAPVKTWNPIDLRQAGLNTDPMAEELPFKIGGLVLPMVMHNAEYSSALKAFSNTVSSNFVSGKSNFTNGCNFFPIVSCGETCDALGYGQDVLDSLGVPGFLFSHRSGETYKRFDNYCSVELFAAIAGARATGRTPVIIAVGGGVNGNSIGLVAAITGSDFIEVPTTPMHFNDATTSAKKAFSLVVDDKILSKNILGAFYLPKLVFCVNEMLLTSSSANIHATIGESTKTMNMLGMAGSSTGARDYHNILGASEFASNTISIVRVAGGFDRLVKFVSSSSFLTAKTDVLHLGRKIIKSRKQAKSDATTQRELKNLLESRQAKMTQLRAQFHSMDDEEKASIKMFLTVVNREIVAAKAMFLAYSDPFEKYRALLFEYAHTLGHGVEAFANGLYARCHAAGIAVPEDALRLHGQCIGMAVLWAGHMSKNLGLLEGEGLQMHQALGYLFNRNNGFSFKPLRDLCDIMGVSGEEFCEGVLNVVRRDNKRGYVTSADPSKSVDQLVSQRPGRMARSDDKNAELRYLVEVDEDWQREVLLDAFNGEFDKVADLQGGNLVFVNASSTCQSGIEEVADKLYAELAKMYSSS